jgi:phage terminase large subunit
VIAEFPAAFEFLWTPSRYKCAYGGRGSGKSQNFARALLLQAAEKPLRVLCCREIQKSIADSVHALLKDQVSKLGLDDFYTVQETTILGKNGSNFIFAGLKHNIASLKSMEGIDRVFVEESHTISRGSLSVLIPTIRKPNSELWFAWNPSLETDPVHQMFVMNEPPPGSIVRKVNWNQNPFFPQVLRDEMEHLKATDYDGFLHVWEGHPITALEGAVYASEIRAATTENRITRVPYDASKPVNTYWDLGFGDAVSIWFIQQIGFEFRVLDFEEDTQKPLQHYLKKLQERPYVYGTHYLPWDGGSAHLGTGKSIAEMMRGSGLTVQVNPQLKVADGINAVRTLFGRCWFDEGKCADGLNSLRHYRYGKVTKRDATGITSDATTREPIHDEHSHAADAFRTFGVGIQEPKAKKPAASPARRYVGAGGWMA